jgi:hypothetical protein
MKLLTKAILVSGMTLAGSAAMAASCVNSNFDAWTTINNPASKLNVTAGSAMAGTDCGMEVETLPQTNGASKHYVQDSSPNAETRYRAAFCLDMNGLTLPDSGSNRRLKIHMAQCTGCANTDVVQFKVQNTGGTYQLNTFVRDSNSGGTKNKSVIDIPQSGPVRVEYDVDLTAGTYKVWIDATAESDTPAADVSGLDTAAWPQITRARIGSMDKSTNVTAAQTFFVDEFESRRQTFIGGGCANP